MRNKQTNKNVERIFPYLFSRSFMVLGFKFKSLPSLSFFLHVWCQIESTVSFCREMKNAAQNILAVPQKAKYSITQDPVISLGIYLKELKTGAQIFVCQFLLHTFHSIPLFAVPKMWKQFKRASVDERINKMLLNKMW